ncbi:MAG: malate:quinone oxidoreductase [Microbacteriaceae bacterium]|nr:malate:quinone oxidoreductase [Microbacteriaceae bacterium]
MNQSATVDVALIGGGIMSATLGTLLKELEPKWRIRVFEALPEVALESSNPWNNAGTGHSALCELNYTKEQPDGSVDISSAVKINEQFQITRQFWSYLVGKKVLPDPKSFINPVPHMSFVWGEDNVKFLKRRFEALSKHPLFVGMEYSEDPKVIYQWAPLLLPGRQKNQKIAATRFVGGTDVDFGSLTRELFAHLEANGVDLSTDEKVVGLRRSPEESWELKLKRTIGGSRSRVRAKFVFVGAGGGALQLLQKSGIAEAKGYGGFPVSGKFLRTDDLALAAKHHAKIYGKASVGAPPMSVPHLDTRIIDGKAGLMFGPYAGFTPKFLQRGTWFDLPFSIRFGNIIPMLAVAKDNLDLVWYLITQVLATKRKKFSALQEFFPDADPKDWRQITAGQRVQVIKKDPKRGGVLQFGTELVCSADGSIAGLLGASPGASTAVPIMLDLLAHCFPDKAKGWESTMKKMIPSFGRSISDSAELTKNTLSSTSKELAIA